MLPLAISIGDLGGVGPEVTFKGLRLADVKRPIVVFGDATATERAIRETRWQGSIYEGLPPKRASSGVYVHSLSRLPALEIRPGKPGRRAAVSTWAHLDAAVTYVHEGKGAGLVTAPIQKEKLAEVGFGYPGHTEFLAAMTGAKKFAMMLGGSRLKVSLVTIHCPLSEVPRGITRPAVYEKIAVTHAALRMYFGIRNPRIAVLGLNPHAGENGLFGTEEKTAIIPAIRQAKGHGWRVSGPHPADGYFGQALENGHDAVVCMYHDQGLIPLKLLHFWDGVNVTLGLPIIRTSPDHGTAYDIAGKNKADARSMAEAIRWADSFARRKKR